MKICCGLFRPGPMQFNASSLVSFSGSWKEKSFPVNLGTMITTLNQFVAKGKDEKWTFNLLLSKMFVVFLMH